MKIITGKSRKEIRESKWQAEKFLDFIVHDAFNISTNTNERIASIINNVDNLRTLIWHEL